MRFCFPTPRRDPCEELNCWRFQVCTFCGWCGNVTARQRVEIELWPMGGWLIDKKFYSSLNTYFKEIGLC
jgi:hypothetical protein